MADEQQPPDQPRDAAAGPDETREMPPAAAGDETREMPPAAAGDETRPVPPAGGTVAFPSASRWSGRAGVPPPDAVRPREAVPVEEELPDGRRWWLPVVLALVALALLALLGLGLWLLLRANDNSAPAPPATPAPSTPATSAAPSPSTPEPATTAPSPTTPAQVVVPRLVGTDRDTAQSILESLGLTARLTPRPDPRARPGTVLETDPAEGSVVPAGSQVTLVVATAPPPPPATPSVTPPSATPPSDVLPSPSG